jgi:hypothetical protein
MKRVALKPQRASLFEEQLDAARDAPKTDRMRMLVDVFSHVSYIGGQIALMIESRRGLTMTAVDEFDARLAKAREILKKVKQ